MGWVALWYNPDTDEEGQFLGAKIEQILEEITPESYATFKVPKTYQYLNIARDIRYPSNQYFAGLWYPDSMRPPIYQGILVGAQLEGKFIKFTIVDGAIVKLDRSEPYTGVFDETPAVDMLLEIFDDLDLDVSIGDCPSSEMSVVFYNANPLDIVKFVADALGLEYWGDGYQTINIGSRGLNQWYPNYRRVFAETSGVDSSKNYDRVIVRGVDLMGRHIRGVAGEGSNVKTISESNPCEAEVLNNIAAKKLAELNNSSIGAPISFLNSDSYGWRVGDYVYVWRDDLLIFSDQNSSRIMQLTRTPTKATCQLGRLKESVAKNIADLRRWEEQGIYLPGCTSWTINLQDLVGFYHLNEGSGVVARDSSPRVDPQDGNIVNCAWQQNQYLKFLTFNGGSSYVDIGDSITFQSSGKFSVGGWISPSVQDGTSRNVIHKDGQFTLKVVNGAIVLIVYDSGGSPHTFTTAPIVTVGGRNFIMATYDGTTIRIYRNTKVVLEQNIGMSIPSSANKVYIGMGFQGALGEVMLWQRCLYDQEVVELYFFPLVRTV